MRFGFDPGSSEGFSGYPPGTQRVSSRPTSPVRVLPVIFLWNLPGRFLLLRRRQYHCVPTCFPVRAPLLTQPSPPTEVSRCCCFLRILTGCSGLNNYSFLKHLWDSLSLSFLWPLRRSSLSCYMCCVLSSKLGCLPLKGRHCVLCPGYPWGSEHCMAGPQIMSFCPTSFCYSIDEMP